MSHIPTVGRKSVKARAAYAVIYLILAAGALTTLYPFLVMVSTATKSQVDFNDSPLTTIIPRYWYDDVWLFKKYVEDKYANNLDDINAAFNADYAKPEDVTPPTDADRPETVALVNHWRKFVGTLPMVYRKVGFGEHDNAPSRLLLLYREHLRQTFHDDLAALNRVWTEENVSFDGVVPPYERSALKTWKPDLANPKVADWEAFKKTLPDNFFIVTTVDPLFRKYLREDLYEDSLPKLNAAWGSDFKAWNEITFSAGRAMLSPGATADLLRFDEERFPDRMRGATATGLTRASPENLWREALAVEFGTVDRANAVFGTHWRTWDDAQPPQQVTDWDFVRGHRAELRNEFATRNFRTVAGYLLLHGRSVVNTLVFCALAILSALIVNPLCAYALSRYNLPYAYNVLLFLLATMAFPAEVAMIPNFLLLRDLGLLNTFWALVLPGIANGFSIFLLKGFFDSLPRELYEAGILDGATEFTMFRRITMPLSLPIFSVIALNAFTGAYGAFLFAMVVCQDPKMWTLMVWLYDLQSRAPQYVIFAALTLAALPTLVVFLFAQKVILRGIILPSFK